MQNVLPFLALLACPVGMGLMMWMMARGKSQRDEQIKPEPASVEDLRTEQARLAGEIARLEQPAHARIETPA